VEIQKLAGRASVVTGLVERSDYEARKMKERDPIGNT
jgi:hypothetical protein